jgi:hypothetical protein
MGKVGHRQDNELKIKQKTVHIGLFFVLWVLSYTVGMNWAQRHQIKIFGMLVVILGLLGFYLIYPQLTKEATCFDSKQNGDEFGIDCGGSCQLVCSVQAEDLIVLWSNSKEIVHGRYNSVAYIQNPNPYAGVEFIRYEFRLYDKDNLLIKKRKSSTFIDANANTAIFEGAIDVGNRIPVRTTFEFLGSSPSWVKIGSRELSNVSVIVKDRTLTNTDTSPLLEATLTNGTLLDIEDFDVVAIIYDADGNMVNTSSTYVDILSGSTSKKIYFTWPKAFEEEAVSIEIIPRLYLFD